MLVHDIFTGAVSVTTSDSADITFPQGTPNSKGLYVAVAGNVKVDMADGSTVTITGLTAGVVHRLAVKRVYATDTTATGILAFY